MNLFKELRFAFRSVFRSIGTSTTVILTLALCIAAASSVYTVADTMLLKLLPYEDYKDLAYLGVHFPTREVSQIPISDPEYFDLVEQEQLFEEVAALENRDVNLTGGDRPERIRAQAATANTFPMLGVEPFRGRRFLPEEQGPNPARVAMVSYRLWNERFGGEPDFVGESILLDDEPYEVIGIMPQGFVFGRADAWIPSRVDRSDTDRSDRWIITMTRLRPGLSADRAEAELAALADRLEQQHGRAHPEYQGLDFILQPVYRTILRDLDTSILVLLGSVGLLLLIASANIGNILAARSSARESEMAIRTAMGAGRGRLIRQILMEGVVLGLLGGALGFLVTFWSVGLLLRVIPAHYLPSETEVLVDWPVLFFALAAALVASVLFSAIPIWQSLKPDLALTLREGARGSGGGGRGRWLRNALVVLECGLAIALLIAAGILIRSYDKLQSVDLGFEPEQVVRARVSLPESRYAEPHQVTDFYGQLVRRVQSAPEINSCGLASDLPLHHSPSRPFTVPGRSVEESGSVPSAVTRIVSTGYFETLKIPLLAGRTFERTDGADREEVVVVNETLAERFWPDESPIGRRIRLGEPREDGGIVHVVGVVADTHQQTNLETAVKPEIYLPFRQHGEEAGSLVVLARTDIPPEAAVDVMRREVLNLDPQLPIYEAGTMTDFVEEAVAPQRFAVFLLSIFSGVALVLAALGLYAIVSFSVRLRQREFGLRLALGAERREVRRLVLVQSLKLVGAGLVLGLAGAVASGRFLSSLIYGVSATDVAVYLGVPCFFVIITVVAALLPARQATRVEPVIALRFEGK